MRIYFRVLSVLLAAALLVLGVLVAVEVVLAALGRPSWVLPYSSLASTMRSHSWDSGVARFAASVLCLLGLLLLLPTLLRGRPSSLKLKPITADVDARVNRKGLQRSLGSAAGRLDGIGGARATVSRRKVTLLADSSLKDPGDLPERVEQQVRTTLQELQLAAELTVDVTTHRRS